MKKGLGIFIGCCISIAATAQTDQKTPFVNIRDLVKEMGVLPYYDSRENALERPTLIVLDRSFYGAKEQIGKSLPSHTKLANGAGDTEPTKQTKAFFGEPHGVIMAMLANSVMSKVGQIKDLEPHLHLYQYTNVTEFKGAIDYVIAQKKKAAGATIVLFSGIFEFGGNGDGEGFINNEVSRATRAGVVWINAAGNLGQNTFQWPIQVDSKTRGLLKLPTDHYGVRISCKLPRPEARQASEEGDEWDYDPVQAAEEKAKTKAAQQGCPLRAVLTWNDWGDDEDMGTQKDLDMELLRLIDNTVDSEPIVAAGLKQVNVKSGTPEEMISKGLSLNPREILSVPNLPEGEYLIRIRARSNNFDPAYDKLRLAVTGYHVGLLDQGEFADETTFPPADNPSVITVGDYDVQISSSSSSLEKPELYAPSIVSLGGDQVFVGSSNSAALVAGTVGLLSWYLPTLTREDLLSFRDVKRVSAGNFSPSAGGSAKSDGTCYPEIDLSGFSEHFSTLQQSGCRALSVNNGNGAYIVCPFDPYAQGSGLGGGFFSPMGNGGYNPMGNAGFGMNGYNMMNANYGQGGGRPMWVLSPQGIHQVPQTTANNYNGTPIVEINAAPSNISICPSNGGSPLKPRQQVLNINYLNLPDPSVF